MKNMQKDIKNRTIILTGMMGAGKSTVGGILARRLRLGFIDLDHLIEKMQKMTIPEIFRLYGEKKFRELECKTVCCINPGRKLVISTGGGIVEDERNIEKMREIGRIYYLHAPYDVLYERIKDDTKRPLIQTRDPKKTIEQILKRRQTKYERADFKIDTVKKTAKQITDEIEAIYEGINS